MKLKTLTALALLVLSINAFSKNLDPESYWDIQGVSNPLISPDGMRIIFQKRYIDKSNDSYISELWLMDNDGEDQRFFIKGNNPKWSPNGKKIAFIKKDDNEIDQIYVKYLDNESESKITNFDNPITDFAWSIDGSKIAFSSFEEYENDWLIDIPGKKEGANYEWTEEPNIVTTMHWKRDGQGESKIGENHLFLVDSNGGSAVKISKWGMDYVGDLQWIDDDNLLFTGNNTLNDLETPWKQTSILSLNISTTKLNKISPEEGVYTGAKVSVDKKTIAFLGHDSKDYSSVAFDVFLQSNGKQKKLTKNLPATPRELFWISPDEIVFSVDSRGAAKVMSLNTKNAKLSEVIPDFKHQFVLNSTHKDLMYGVYANDKRPNEISVINGNSLEKITSLNELVLAQYDLGETQEINYKAPDGTKIQGWYITPPEFDPSKKYPLILTIHGGPHAMYRPAFNYLWHQFASDGYVVLFTNPRGSTGYGSEFANVIDNDYPGQGDLSDLLAGVDHLVELDFIDQDRMYVQGCSGGGVLTAWVVGHDDRFAAAASLCPVTNWISMVGTTDIAAWTFEWFDKPFWEDPSNWLDRSPIMRTGFIKTPTLFMTGVLDIRTPMPQTEEMYIALKEAGIDTAMIRMNKEWHGTSRVPTNWFRTYGYLSDWYERYPNK